MNLRQVWKGMSIRHVSPLALGLALLISVSVHAQVSGGTVSGSISDSSGAAVPNAQISLQNVSTGVVRVVSTDAAGFYTAPNLLPGTYQVKATAPGFSTEVRNSVTLAVGAELQLNIKMEVGQVSQTIEVTAEAPDIQLVSSAITDQVDSNTVRELPLNGRDWTQLAVLEAGVSTPVSIQPSLTTGFDRGNRGFGAQLIVSGSRPQQTSYFIDGINVNDYTGGSPGSVFGASLGVDAIQEFSVLTTNYSAEYGRTSGGVVTSLTRPGTNQLHGDVYEFLRNSALDARNFFDGPTIPHFSRNQFGASVGGPIRKNRLFFFVDYEGIRQALGVTNVDKVPSPDARKGIIHNSDGTTTTITVDPAVTPFLALWPLPNSGLLGSGNTGEFTFPGNQVTSENFVTGRIDYKISEKDSVFGSFQSDPASLVLPSNLDATLVESSTTRRFVALEENHIFNPQLLNTARIGLNRSDDTNETSLSAINPAAADPSLGAVPGFNAPTISVAGLTSFSAGLNANTHNRFNLTSIQIYDDVFWTKGSHSLKLGFAAEREVVSDFNVSAPGGNWAYGSLVNFLTNGPATSFRSLLPASVIPIDIHQSIFAGYAQDDIRVRHNVTLNLGLRYEMSTVPTEAQNKLSPLNNLFSPVPHIGNPLFSNPTYRNFEPRVGFAWDPFGDGKTSVRSGFGVFDVLPLIYENQLSLTNTPPYFESVGLSSIPAGEFPTGAFSQAVASPNIKLNSAYIQPNPKRNYVMQWNLNIQHQLTPNLSATIAYVGTRGLHLPEHEDESNLVLPTLTPSGYLWPFPAGSGTTINPTLGRVGTTIWGSDSHYEALEAQVTRRLSHGLQIQGAYTWSKSIDNSSTSDISDNFQNSITSLFWFSDALRRALSDFNVTHSLTINYLWDIPTPHSLHGATMAALGGWEIGGVIHGNTGTPFTPLIAGDPMGLNDLDPYAYPNVSKGSGCRSLINPGNVNNYINLQCFSLPVATTDIAAECTPFQPGGPGNPIATGTCSNLLGNSGRNELIGPGIVNFDFSLYKNNYIKRISESFNVQFRMEIFNAFNRADFLSPIDNEYLFDQTGAPIDGAGAIDNTASPSREIQFALKVIF